MTFSRFFAFGAVAAMVVSGTAQAQVDEAAKKAVMESVEAMQKAKFLSFHMVSNRPGNFVEDVDVKITRDHGAPVRMLFDGTLTFMPGGAKKSLVQMDHLDKPVTKREITWADFDAKTVTKQKTGGPNGPDIWISRAEGQLSAYDVTRNPFEADLRAKTIQFDAAAVYDGVPCTVIIMTLDEKEPNGRKLAIGTIDKLPRYYEKYRGGAKQTVTYTKVSDAEFKPEDAVLKAPAGFKFIQMPDPAAKPAEAAQQPKAATAQPDGGLRNTAGGLKVGTPVQPWELGQLDGAKVKSDELKGKTVVLGFWSLRMAGSTTTTNTLDEIARAVGAETKVFGVACRMTDEEDFLDVKKIWETNKFAYSTLIHGDDLLTKMNVRGMPAFVVIDGEGKVKAFFEGAAGASQILDAVKAK